MKKDSKKYNIYHGVVAGGRWVLFAIVSFIILFPVYWIFISSITPSGELFKTPIDYLPDHPGWKHWICTKKRKNTEHLLLSVPF